MRQDIEQYIELIQKEESTPIVNLIDIELIPIMLEEIFVLDNGQTLQLIHKLFNISRI